MVALDSRIEERNGDAVPVVARQRNLEAVPCAGGQAFPLDHLRRLRRGIRDADRVHARDLGHALDQPEHLWIDRRREPGEHARVDVFRPDSYSLLGELGDQLVRSGQRG